MKPREGIRGIKTPGDPVPHPDQDIVLLLRHGGHVAAFEEIVKRYEAKVYRLCCGLLRDRALAEDVAQESLLRVWKSLSGYDGRAALSTWIYTVARNRCLTALEKRRSARSLQAAAANEVHRTNVAAGVAVAAATGEEWDEDMPDLLRQMVDQLPERYRQTIVLYYYEERSLIETAAMLGVPEGTAKTNLHRGRAMLLDRMRQAGLSNPLQWLVGAV
jgi:RNA polymerase sigma-70 factor (ECF subfamily)